jgi:hypothetical protein
MHRALLSTIFAGLTASVAPAHAHPTSMQPLITPVAIAQVTLPSAAQVTVQKASDTVKVSAPRELPVAAIEESPPTPESMWGKYGTLLATVVVMFAIALRRQRLGRP